MADYGCTSVLASTLQVLLDEAGIEVNVDLHQRRVTNRLEAVNLTGLDDKDIARATLEGLAVDGPNSPAFTNELDFIIRVPVRTRSRTRLSMEQEHRDACVALFRSNKLMRTTNKRQILLAHVMHSLRPSCGLDETRPQMVTRHAAGFRSAVLPAKLGASRVNEWRAKRKVDPSLRSG